MKQQIYFVTGKGGVGKSAYAAALAKRYSESGKKVLLVELGNESFYQDYLAIDKVRFKATSTDFGFDIAQWPGKEVLREYAGHLIKVDAIANLFFENKVMRTFVDIAPGLQELAIMGKVTSSPRRHGPPLDYDYIIVDAYASGHFKALLEAPRGMGKAIPIGPMGEQSRGIEAVLTDSTICQYHIVSLPEELPLKESIELGQWLKAEFGVDAKYIVNKVITFPFDKADLQAATSSDGKLFADYLLSQSNLQEETVTKYLGNGRTTLIPWFFENSGKEVVGKIAEKISFV